VRTEETPKTIAVDLTPVLPGGENGGAKIFVLELIRCLSDMAPNTRFVLLTQAVSHDELAWLDGDNVCRHLATGPAPNAVKLSKLAELAKVMMSYFPSRLRGQVNKIVQRVSRPFDRRNNSQLLHEIGADLLFCPFTAPLYDTPGVPTVCTIYDLQYKTYPEFFSSADVTNRDRAFREACRYATFLAAISNYSRITALRHSNLNPDRIRTIYLRMAQRVTQNRSQNLHILEDCSLAPKRYLIYPANFWKHKSHEMLLTAFGMACRRGLNPDVKLVCTGVPGERQQYLANAAIAMCLTDRLVFPGYLSNEDLACLMANASGLIFPSLYEGFGLPVIEAMAAGVPVACSNTTSLPEVATGAAIFFNPRIPTEIAAAITSLASESSARPDRQELIANGLKRAAEFADSGQMAREYWNLFIDAFGAGPSSDELFGVYPDTWCGPKLTFQSGPSTSTRTLQFELEAPGWLPARKVNISALYDNKKRPSRVLSVRKGTTEILTLVLSPDVNHLELLFTPVFVPSEHSMGVDARSLSVMIKRCTVRSSDCQPITVFPDDTTDSAPKVEIS
jgi:glycosyltransferase involved in cell wall biosynthesis